MEKSRDSKKEKEIKFKTLMSYNRIVITFPPFTFWLFLGTNIKLGNGKIIFLTLVFPFFKR